MARTWGRPDRAICKVGFQPARCRRTEADSLPFAVQGARVDHQNLRGLLQAGGVG
jgi:hypothetical protein